MKLTKLISGMLSGAMLMGLIAVAPAAHASTYVNVTNLVEDSPSVLDADFEVVDTSTGLVTQFGQVNIPYSGFTTFAQRESLFENALFSYASGHGFTVSDPNIVWPWTASTTVQSMINTSVAAVPAAHAYEGTTNRTGAFPVFKSATVSSGTAVFNLTTDGTSGGTALFPNGVIADSVNTAVSDALASYQMSWAFSNSNKTLTVTANKLTTANILTGILGQSSANGAVVKLNVWGY